MGDLTPEERRAYDRYFAAIISRQEDLGAVGWPGQMADASERAIVAVEHRRRLFPRDAQR